MKALITLTFISFLNISIFAQGSWFNVNLPSSANNCTDIYFIDANTGFVHSGNEWMTTTGGSSWFINSSVPGGTISFINSATGYIGTGSSIYKTTNSGINWSLLCTTPVSLSKIKFIDENTGIFLYDGSTQSSPLIYKTSNGGSSWTAVYSPPGSGELKFLTAVSFGDANTGVAVGQGGTSFQDALIVRTTDGGSTWSTNTLTMKHLTCVRMVNSNSGYTAGDPYLYGTSTGGASWSQISSMPFCTLLYFTNVNTGYAVYGSSIFGKTTNGGFNWTTQQVPNSVPVNDVYFINLNTGWAASNGGAILKTINGGDNYHTISGQIRFQDNNQPVNMGCVKALKSDRILNQIITVDSTSIQSNGDYSLNHIPQDSLYIMAFENDESQLLFVPTYYPSTTNWQNAAVLYPTGNLSNINVLVYRINNTGGPYHIAGHVYANTGNPLLGLNNSIVYAKVGSDYKSYSISNGAGLYRVDSLLAGNYTLTADRIGYVPMNRPVLISTFSKDTIDLTFNLIGVVRKDKYIPKDFWLGNNYPNPFNPATKISFGIPKTSNTKLKIYDITGREVSELINKDLEVGNYTIIWDARDFANGVYFYKLESGDFVQTKKMVLIK
ncbi:MAG: T9SS type A sorting domain-containing protein [Ignavibacteria bacterium]